MREPFDPFEESVAWVADTGFFVACGRQQNNKYTALERFANRNELTFVIPQRVYEELGGSPDRSTPGQTPINSARDAGWVRVADEPEYANSTVSRVMDDIRAYVARASNREEDQIEKADTALGAVAATLLDNGDARSVCIVTTDTDAGEGAIAALATHGFENRSQYMDGFDLIEQIT